MSKNKTSCRSRPDIEPCGLSSDFARKCCDSKHFEALPALARCHDPPLRRYSAWSRSSSSVAAYAHQCHKLPFGSPPPRQLRLYKACEAFVA